MTTLNINGQKVKVGDEFLSMSPDQQEATVMEIAQSLGIEQQDGPNAAERFLGQAARSIGGAADAIVTGARNDVRRFRGDEIIPHGGEGSITNALADAGIASRDAPSGALEAAGAGAGDAIVAFAPVIKALQSARGVGGVTGAIADDAYAALATRLGLGTEVAAGAASGGAQQAVADAGGSETMQSLAGLAAPLSVPAAGAALRGTVSGAGRVADKLPVSSYLMRAGREVAGGFAPMTEAGAREQARRRAVDIVGGEDRAEEIGRAISPSDEFGRTPAQQTGDPKLLGLEEAARAENPVLRERLNARDEATQTAITDAVRSLGGDVADARTFFRRRLSQFKTAMGDQVDEVLARGDDAIEGVNSSQPASQSSERVVEKLNAAHDAARTEERALWAQIPGDVTVPTANVKAVAQNLIQSNSKFQRDDIPAVINQLVGNEVGDTEAVSELHGLYSELRRIARVARAGDTQNRNTARIADGVAEAILKEFDNLPGSEIAEARAFTRALNETFHTGAPGKLLARTNQSVERVPPEAALRATVGRGQAQGGVDARQIANAAPDASQDVGEFLRSGFNDAAVNASGTFTPKAARTWMRNNAEALAQQPGLRQELDAALVSREAADAFRLRSEARTKIAEDGTIARFNSGQPEKAVTAILGADNPIKAARSIANAARKDPSGKALDGVKGAFSSYLTEDVTRLPALMADPKIAGAMTRVFSPAEYSRLKKITEAMQRTQAPSQNVGEVVNNPTTKVVDFIVRYYAAKTASSMHSGGGAGVDLQTAQMASSRAREWLSNLTNDGARRILMDAIEDPALMRALLTDAPGPKLPQRARSKLAPYLTGAIAAED